MPRGVVLIYVVLILGSVSLAALAMLARSGIHAFVDATESATSFSVRTEVFGCLDEVLVHLQGDDTFAPPTVATGYATCQLAVTTPVSGEREVTVTLTEGLITRRIIADITLDPFAVTRVAEE